MLIVVVINKKLMKKKKKVEVKVKFELDPSRVVNRCRRCSCRPDTDVYSGAPLPAPLLLLPLALPRALLLLLARSLDGSIARSVG